MKVVLEAAQQDNLARKVSEGTLPDELESDIKALRQLLEKDKYIIELTAELDTSRSNAKQLRAELETVQNAHVELVKQLEFWTESFESVRELQALKDEETAELDRQLKYYREELTRCQRELAQAISEKHTAVKEMNAEIDALRQRMVLKEEQNGRNLTSLEELKQNNLGKGNCRCMEELTRCQGDLAQAISDKEHNAKKDMQAELVALRQRMSEIEEHHVTLVKTLGDAQTRLQESEQNILGKENRLKALKDLSKEMKGLVDAQQHEIEIVKQTAEQDLTADHVLREGWLDALRCCAQLQERNNALVKSLDDEESKQNKLSKENLLPSQTFTLSFPLTSFASPSTSITPTPKALTGVVAAQQAQQQDIQSAVNQEIADDNSRHSPKDPSLASNIPFVGLIDDFMILAHVSPDANTFQDQELSANAKGSTVSVHSLHHWIPPPLSYTHYIGQNSDQYLVCL